MCISMLRNVPPATTVTATTGAYLLSAGQPVLPPHFFNEINALTEPLL